LHCSGHGRHHKWSLQGQQDDRQDRFWSLPLTDNAYRLARVYALFLDAPVELHLGQLQITEPLLRWINDGLMAMFFLLSGWRSVPIEQPRPHNG
jgi:hypothetical protein